VCGEAIHVGGDSPANKSAQVETSGEIGIPRPAAADISGLECRETGKLRLRSESLTAESPASHMRCHPIRHVLRFL
jgi:hypothetical protein